jgi:hypothetical protein
VERLGLQQWAPHYRSKRFSRFSVPGVRRVHDSPEPAEALRRALCRRNGRSHRKRGGLTEASFCFSPEGRTSSCSG